MSELPQGWVATTLGDLGRWSSGGTPSKRKPEYYGGDIPWVRTGDLRDNEIHDVEGRISPEGLANSSAKEFPSGTLLVAMYGATIGRTGMLCIPATTNQACAALLPDPVTEDMMPFLWWFFRHKVEDFRAVGQGGAQPNISQTVIKASAIDLPPLTEQRRIVAKLDRLSARSAAARDHLARTTKLATRAKQAILAEVFRDANGTAEDYIESTFYGPRFAKTAYVREGIPTLRTTDFRADGVIQLGDAPMVEVSEKEMSKWGLADGDLLVTRTGSIGKSAVYEKEMGPALPSAYLIRVRLNLAKADPWFVYYAFASPEGQRFLGASATAITQPNVNAKAIRTVPVPLLELQAQKEIVRRIEAAFARIDRMTEEASRAAHLLDRLDERLLAKAFRGELVPQDPDDEPAEALLTRIREARAAAPKAKRGRRKKAEA